MVDGGFCLVVGVVVFMPKVGVVLVMVNVRVGVWGVCFFVCCFGWF